MDYDHISKSVSNIPGSEGVMSNKNRCKACGVMGGSDGYCKRHRPVFVVKELDRSNNRHVDPFRKNFKDFGFGFERIEDVKEFGITSDFGVNRKWGGR